jgi:hypothetical protein
MFDFLKKRHQIQIRSLPRMNHVDNGKRMHLYIDRIGFQFLANFKPLTRPHSSAIKELDQLKLQKKLLTKPPL